MYLSRGLLGRPPIGRLPRPTEGARGPHGVGAARLGPTRRREELSPVRLPHRCWQTPPGGAGEGGACAQDTSLHRDPRSVKHTPSPASPAGSPGAALPGAEGVCHSEDRGLFRLGL